MVTSYGKIPADAHGIVVDAMGNVYTLDSFNNKIIKISPGSLTNTTFANL